MEHLGGFIILVVIVAALLGAGIWDRHHRDQDK